VGVLLPLAMTLVPVILILRQPNLGTAVLFVPVLLWMLFAAGVRRRDLAWLGLLGLSSLPLLWDSNERRAEIARHRHVRPTRPPRSSRCGHLSTPPGQADDGPGRSVGEPWDRPGRRRPAGLPSPRGPSDFILCVLVERLGLAGGAAVLGLYGVLVWRGLAIAAAAREPFGRLVAAGLTGMLAVQVLVNVGMTVGLLPVVGLSLPLVSYGGSGLVTQGALIGLLVNVAIRPGYEVAGEPFRYEMRPHADFSRRLGGEALSLLRKES